MSHRLGGYDGVSVEAAKWQRAFRVLGCSVTRAAGIFVDGSGAADVEVPGLWANTFGAPAPPPDLALINDLCRNHDLLVIDNVGSLPTAPHTAIAFEAAALSASTPTIVRHHDPPWQVTSLLTPGVARFPLADPRMLHVTINRLTEAEFRRRHPALAAAEAVTTVYNTVDSEALRVGDRAGTRRRMGVGSADLLIAHPARNIVRKNVPAAVAAAGELHRRTGRRVHYWLTDPAGELPDAPDGVTFHRGHAVRPADLFAAADVVALTSNWEGWGLPVVESAAARRPAITADYPVLSELRQLGIATVDHTDISRIADLLTCPTRFAAFTAANAAAAAALDIAGLPGDLGRAAQRASALMTGEAMPRSHSDYSARRPR